MFEDSFLGKIESTSWSQLLYFDPSRLVTYYHNGSARDKGFICGGSLVSRKIVVTAAHCILEKDSLTRRKAEDATFYLGRYNLTLKFERYSLSSKVSELILHPDWSSKGFRYDADVAIAVLIQTINLFNNYIQPICLPTEPSYNDMIDRKGQVAGWGLTHFDNASTTWPMFTTLKVVSESDCLGSDHRFYFPTSHRTFCAGDVIGGSGPCNGDSGGGFVLEKDSKWNLRGIISNALKDSDGACDTTKFAVFTDVSKFSDWIRGYMRRFG